MPIAKTLSRYLIEREVPYDVIAHPQTVSSMETAQAVGVPGDRVAKTVVLEDEQGYVLAVVPATHRVDLGELHRQLNRNLGLATEAELARLFEDCELGAIPAVGPAYGMETVVDDRLAEQPDVYFEGGDHEQLVHVTGETFDMLLGDAPHSRFSYHV